MNENPATGESFVPESTGKQETTFEIETQLATEIEDEVKTRQRELNQETKKIVYRSFCFFVCLGFYYYIGIRLLLVFYLLAWGSIDTPLVIPNWLDRLYGKIQVFHLDKQRLGGMRLMLIDDPEASIASLAVTAPVGYFKENEDNYPGGLNYLLSTEVLLNHMARDSKCIDRNGLVEPEVTFWSFQTEESTLLSSLSAFWGSFSSLDRSGSKSNRSNMIAFE